MTSPGLPDWDPLEVPVDETAEPPDAHVGCTSDEDAALDRTAEPPRSPG